MAQYIKNEDGTWTKIGGMEANLSIDDTVISKNSTWSSDNIDKKVITPLAAYSYADDLNNCKPGSVQIWDIDTRNTPEVEYGIVSTFNYLNEWLFQIAITTNRGNPAIYKRSNINNEGWSPWVLMSDISKTGHAIYTPPENNMDNAKEPGSYMYIPSIANCPSEYGMVQVFKANSWIWQLAMGTYSYQQWYVRCNINDVGWSPWQHFAFATE